MIVRKWLSCDNMFKVFVNIGFWFNKIWVKFCDTLFIVFNEEEMCKVGSCVKELSFYLLKMFCDL